MTESGTSGIHGFLDVAGLGSQRDAFDVPEDVAYFNTASLSPVLHSVLAAGEAALRRRAQPWRIRSADWFSDVERLRSLFPTLVRADTQGLALVPPTPYVFPAAP